MLSRICRSIPNSINPDLTDRKSIMRIVSAYSQMVVDRTDEGWSCDLLTFMFNPIFGSVDTVLNHMKDEVERIYSTLLTRICRRPRSRSLDQLPFLIACADLPVPKIDKRSSKLVVRNEGLHFHGLLLTPAESRLRRGLADHFREHDHIYCPDESALQRIDVKGVSENHAYVLEYVFKTVLATRLSYDDSVLVLPKTRLEA